MRIFEFADMIGAQLVFIRRDKETTNYTNMRYYCHFEKCNVKNGSFLHGSAGNGNTIKDALKSYVEQIAGELIVFNAMSEEYRKEYRVPKDLTI